MTNKRGNTQLWLTIVGGIAIGVVTITIIAIMLGALRTGLVTQTVGCNTASSAYTNCGFDYNITTRGLSFVDESTKQLGTTGTIAGVSLLLLIIGLIGFGAYAGYKRFN